MTTDTIENLVEKIGETAGLVWRYLNENGEVNLTQLKKGVEAPNDVLHQAIGWLAREGKLTYEKDNRSVRVALLAGK
ncbi:MAG: winged helix-turn-helix domain-containing protein [Candidatus Schekmanbacteria bacterium]|nr:winged helix-turn-helix domain-containing protein [Candidatus Schekmanbacteria bacterium]